MFFKVFTPVQDSPLPHLMLFAIEHETSQILANCEISALQKAVGDQILPETLFKEVEFFGAIPRDNKMQNEVIRYFQAHAQSLYEIAQQLLDEPENETLRNDIQQPLFPEDELQQMIGTS